MPDNTQQRLIRDLFDAARELPAAERQVWVEARAGGNPEVVASVMRLLRAANASGQGFLAEPAFKRQAPALEEGMMIGPYRVLRELGSGGMGVVYLAMRSDEVYRRLAAVKVIRPELRDNPLKERFLREREILAALDHPNIARIVDGGNTPDGLPYFVMDYVDGQPLDEYCRNQRATLEQRLSLFLQTCQAVQYLHDNNVLHRDLKPANILVTHTGQVKLLDFGVSKLGFSKTGFDSKVTLGAPVLTAGYASPEQITSKPVTAGSDIYSLGVVLYELLTGVRPLKLDSKNLPEILETITGQVPPKPSTQQPLSEEADPGHLLASIRPRLAGDMDSILLMALRKEPLRRYPSATAFADDIQRFLERRPVAARGDGAAYVVTKTIRRNRMRIAALILIGISLAGAGVALWRALDYRSQLESLRNDLGQLRNHQEQYRSLPAPEARALMQHDLDHLSSQIAAKTPAILKSNLAPKGTTRQLMQQSLTYFADTQSAAGNDPDTVAALGRAYLAVAQTQWSSDHASLNDPKEALDTCLQAVKALTADKNLTQSPEIQQTLGQIRAVLEANPATQQQAPQGEPSAGSN
jgi:eukaryotic-like serine/threonine-protein kinase